MPIPPELMPNEETSILWKIVLGIFGAVVTFTSGVITATTVIVGKVQGWENRLSTVEDNQKKCQNGPLTKIDEKLDFIIESGLPEVHKRIDAVLLRDRKE